jgi:hypothetical protein
VPVLVQYQQIRQRLMDVQLFPGSSDHFEWGWSPSGQYSSRSSYNALLLGQVVVLDAKQLWKVKAPNEVHFFWWLVLHGCCWASDRLQHHGLRNNGPCVLCQQEAKTLHHLLVQCAFSRETWFKVLRWCEWQHLALTSTDLAVNWWLNARKRVPRTRRLSFDYLVLLVARQIWLQRNDRVFRGQCKQPSTLINQI